MLRFKEYADSKGITVQVVYKHIKKRQKEFEGHIIKQYGVQYLDDEAIAMLNSIIRDNTLVVLDNSKDEEIKKLQEENSRLKDHIISLSDRLLEQSEQKSEAVLKIAELSTKVTLLEAKKKKRWWQKKSAE